jgi:hypothetical protein
MSETGWLRYVVSVGALTLPILAWAQGRGPMLWTVSGAGAGFSIGLCAGLSAFDDAVNSDRKVWTSAIVGAGVGAVAGYLIATARHPPSAPSTGHDRRRSTCGYSGSWRSRSALTAAGYVASRCVSARTSGSPRRR